MDCQTALNCDLVSTGTWTWTDGMDGGALWDLDLGEVSAGVSPGGWWVVGGRWEGGRKAGSRRQVLRVMYLFELYLLYPANNFQGCS